MVTIPPLAKLNHDSIPLLERDAPAQLLHRTTCCCRSRTRRSPIRTSRRTRTSSTSRRPARWWASRARAASTTPNSGMFHVEVGARPVHRRPDRRRGRADLRPVGLPDRGHAAGQAVDAGRWTARTCPARRSSRRTSTRPRRRPSSGLIDLTSQTPMASTTADGARHRQAARERACSSRSGSRRLQTREAKGLPIVDPLVNPDFKQQDQLAKKLGLKWDGPNLARPEDGQVKTAIRKHLGDFLAICALCVLALGVTGYILSHERLPLPVPGGAVPGQGGVLHGPGGHPGPGPDRAHGGRPRG